MIAESDKFYGIHEFALVHDLIRAVDDTLIIEYLDHILSIREIDDDLLISLLITNNNNLIWSYKHLVGTLNPS